MEYDDDNDGELHNYKGKLCNFQTEGCDKSLARIMTDRYIDEEGDEQIEMLWEELIEENGTDYDKNNPHLLKAQSRYRKAAELERKKEVIRDEEGGSELILPESGRISSLEQCLSCSSRQILDLSL